MAAGAAGQQRDRTTWREEESHSCTTRRSELLYKHWLPCHQLAGVSTRTCLQWSDATACSWPCKLSSIVPLHYLSAHFCKARQIWVLSDIGLYFWLQNSPSQYRMPFVNQDLCSLMVTPQSLLLCSHVFACVASYAKVLLSLAMLFALSSCCWWYAGSATKFSKLDLQARIWMLSKEGAKVCLQCSHRWQRHGCGSCNECTGIVWNDFWSVAQKMGKSLE